MAQRGAQEWGQTDNINPQPNPNPSPLHSSLKPSCSAQPALPGWLPLLVTGRLRAQSCREPCSTAQPPPPHRLSGPRAARVQGSAPALPRPLHPNPHFPSLLVPLHPNPQPQPCPQISLLFSPAPTALTTGLKLPPGHRAYPFYFLMGATTVREERSLWSSFPGGAKAEAPRLALLIGSGDSPGHRWVAWLLKSLAMFASCCRGHPANPLDRRMKHGGGAASRAAKRPLKQPLTLAAPLEHIPSRLAAMASTPRSPTPSATCTGRGLVWGVGPVRLDQSPSTAHQGEAGPP